MKLAIEREEIRIGVVSDTHIPDRIKGLHPALLPALRARQVDLILHAGDISTPRVLAELEQVAPVLAVRGNRDFAFWGKLPLVQTVEVGSVQIAMMHGHGNWKNYLWDKWQYVREGYRLERYHPLLLGTVPDARVIIFGHTHRPVMTWQAGRMLFNPGSASKILRAFDPTFGIIRVRHGHIIEGEIVDLQGDGQAPASRPLARD
ncbi:MAG: YfcE family phosphodiesterase [Anaerolineaceae bacterium]|nr:YfcE family phosphodiesterase [Anaerolineaceae bacterium]